jgi:CRP/FNR family transcriptional regulator
LPVLRRKTAQVRVASFLLGMLRRKERLGQTAKTLTMTRSDIADFLGLTIETVSRTFTNLRTLGCIALKSAINRDDLETLANLA